MSVINIGFLFFLVAVLSPASSILPALLLSPLINQGHVQEARNLSLVNPNHFLNISSHAGFLTVDEKHNSNIYFWYFPTAGKMLNETPWIIWLQGGPGASSLAGLFDEIGPFEYNPELKKLKDRKSSWLKDYSLLFLDNPVGAGFSFTNSIEGLARSSISSTEHLFSALQQFLTIFPELRKAPLYVAGESYAGHYVPPLAVKILKSSKPSGDNYINLQGIILGDPILDREDQTDFISLYYSWGLIDSQGGQAAKPFQDAYIKAIKSQKNKEAEEFRNTLLDKLDNIAYQRQDYNVLQDDMKFNWFEEYINQDHIKEAIHAGDITFTFSNSTVRNNFHEDVLINMTPKMENLLDNYKVLIYCGQLDLVISCSADAQARRKKWHWKGRDKFLKAQRIPWWYNESVAGYVKSGGGLTEALVRGSGHMGPIDKPEQMYQLVSYFIRGLDMPMPSNYRPEDPSPYEEKTERQQEPVLTTATNNTGLIVSVVLNVIFILCFVAGIVLYIRWKKRNDNYFYSTVDTLNDGILSMS